MRGTIWGRTTVESKQIEGPRQPHLTTDQLRLQQLELEWGQHQTFLAESGFDREIAEDFSDRLCRWFTAQTQEWFKAFQDSGYDHGWRRRLQDLWTYDWEEHTVDVQDDMARVFLYWGQHHLEAVTAEWEDGEAEVMVEEEFYNLIQDLPPCMAQQKGDTLANRLQHQRAKVEQPDSAVPHRAVHRTGCKHQGSHTVGIPAHFIEQRQWDKQLRQVQHWGEIAEETMVTPLPRMVTGGEAYIVVHLFSGRRREGDFHAHLTQLCRNAPFAVTVLSLDTAVSQETGNLAERSDSWIQIDKLYRAGLVAFTLAGSPCKTFSEARHQRPEDCQEEDRWPRPLRSARELWGLGLTRKKTQPSSGWFPPPSPNLVSPSPDVADGRILCFRASSHTSRS